MKPVSLIGGEKKKMSKHSTSSQAVERRKRCIVRKENQLVNGYVDLKTKEVIMPTESDKIRIQKEIDVLKTRI